MDESKLNKISEDLIVISRKHGSDRVKIPADYDQALQHVKKFNFKKAASFTIGDDSVVDKVRQLADDQGNKRVWVLVNKYDSTTDVYTLRDADLATASPSKNTSGCFIATAVYGSYCAPEVLLLRQFRDKILTTFFFGRAFIKLYYVISPFIAKRLERCESAKKMIKKLILNPIIKNILNSKGEYKNG
jgi:hypothetical protein